MRRGQDDRRAAPLGPRRSQWGVLAGLTTVTFLVLLDDTAVSVVLPAIQTRLRLGLSELEWVVNAYTVTLAAFTIAAGRLADRYGARRIFLTGLAVFLVGSLASGLAPVTSLLLAARIVQGTGAALIAPATLAIIASVFPRERHGTAVGIWAGVSAVALGAGPLVGAAVGDAFGWQWVFLLNIPLGIAAWLTARLLLPPSRPVEARRLDFLGAVLSASGLLALLLALSEVAVRGWGASTVGLLAAAAVLLWLFAVRQRRAADPLIDAVLVRSRSFSGANAVMLLSTAVMCSLFFFLALFFQTVLGLSALASAASLLPLTGTIIVISPLAGRLADRLGNRVFAVSGMLVLAVSLLGMSRAGADAGIAGFIVWLAVGGIGIAMARTPTTTTALSAAGTTQYGVAAGIFNTSQAIGLAVGIAVMGAILGSFGAGDAAFLEGFSAALLVNAGIAVVAAVVAAVTFGDRQGAIRTDRRPNRRIGAEPT